MKTKEVVRLAVLMVIVVVLSLTVPWWVSDVIKKTSKPSTPEISEETVEESMSTQENSEEYSVEEASIVDIQKMYSLEEVAKAYAIDESKLRTLCQIAIEKAMGKYELSIAVMYVTVNSSNWKKENEYNDEIIFEQFRDTVITAVQVLLGQVRDPTSGAKYFIDYEKLGYTSIGSFLNNNPVGECYVIDNMVFIKYLPETLNSYN